MSVLVDPKLQEEFDRNVAEHQAASERIAAELEANEKEVAERVAATKEEFAAIGQEVQAAYEKEGSRPPVHNPEDDDVSARAEDYQEFDEEEPAPTAPARPVATTARPADEDEVVHFRWDEDEQPARAPRAAQRPARAREEEDLSEHDWLE